MLHSREGTPAIKGGVTQEYLGRQEGLGITRGTGTEDRINAVVQKLGPMRLWNESGNEADVIEVSSEGQP